MAIPQIITLIPILLAALVGIGFLIGFHEFGHFLFCKLFGIRTPSFSIGFGPRIIEKKIGETNFALSAIPLGGYVEIAGAQEIGQGDQKEAQSRDKHSFATKPYYQKMLVIAGGIFFNLILAYGILILLFMNGIEPTKLLYPINANSTIERILPDSPASKAGLQPQDIITKVNETPVSPQTMQTFVENLTMLKGSTITLTIQRGDTIIPFAIELGDGIKSPILGALFQSMAIPPKTFLNSLYESHATIMRWIVGTFTSFKSMIQNRSTKGLAGPIALISETAKSAQQGLTSFFLVLCFISVNLAILNVLPFPIFDGGQALFYTAEAILGISLDSVRIYVHYVSWILILVLTLYITCKDIMHICS